MTAVQATTLFVGDVIVCTCCGQRFTILDRTESELFCRRDKDGETGVLLVSRMDKFERPQ